MTRQHSIAELIRIAFQRDHGWRWKDEDTEKNPSWAWRELESRLATVAVLPGAKESCLPLFKDITTNFFKHFGLRPRDEWYLWKNGWENTSQGIDSALYELFNIVDDQHQHAFNDATELYHATRDVRAAIAAIGKLRIREHRGTRKLGEPIHTRKVFGKSLGFLHDRHARLTADMILEKVAGQVLPPELLDIIQDDLVLVYSPPRAQAQCHGNPLDCEVCKWNSLSGTGMKCTDRRPLLPV